MSVPPIPVRLAGRPTVGGLVVPWASLQAPPRTSDTGSSSRAASLTTASADLSPKGSCGSVRWTGTEFSERSGSVCASRAGSVSPSTTRVVGAWCSSDPSTGLEGTPTSPRCIRSAPLILLRVAR
jgi:hypothetical protein